MLKNILNLEGAQKLTNVEQKSINGGIPYCAVGCVRIFSGTCASVGMENCCISGWCQ